MAKKKEAETVLAVKAFDANLSCRGYKFEVGKTYSVDGEVVICQNGFHACENPFDALSYYPLVDNAGKLSRFASVELTGQIARHSEDSKVAGASITLKAELSLPEFIGKAVSWIVDYTKLKAAKKDGAETLNDNGGDYAKIGSSGYYAQIGSSGDCAKIGSSGDCAQIGSSGHSAQIGSSGHSAKIGSSGDCAQIGSSGYYAKIGSSGYCAKIGSSGDCAKIGSSGDCAKIGSSGDCAKIVAEGKDAVVACAGARATVSGKDGTWVSLAEYGDNGKCVGFATGRIGKDGLKPDTAYTAKTGKLVEVSK
jgi:hypothetical protein